MSIVECLSQPFWQRLGLTLVHFLWQGLAVAVLVGVFVRMLRLRHGNARYGAYLLAFIAMIACPVVTFTAIDIDISANTEFVTVAEPAEVVDISPPPYTALPAGDVLPEIETPRPAIPISADSIPLGQRISGWLNVSMPWVLVIWMAGVAVLSVRLLIGFVGVYRWRHHLEPLPERLAQRIASLSEGLGMRGFSRVFISPTVLQAMAVGYLRPMVLLPAAMLMQMQPEMLEAVIAHELAHIRRFDLWVNLAQRVTETLLFYHPAVWWLSNCLRRERELCCDELAVKATGERITYASTLESVGRARFMAKQPVLATGLGRDKKPILSRVRHILGLKPTQRNCPFWLAGVITVLFLAALVIPTTLALTLRSNEQADIPEKKDQKELSKFKTTLANGVTVELIGMCEYPNVDKQWWRPDGSLLVNPPYDESNLDILSSRSPDAIPIEFAFRLSGNLSEPAWEARVKGDEQAFVWWTGRQAKDGEFLTDIKSIGMFVKSDQRTLDLRLGFSLADRPYEWIDFKNISIKPNFKPDVDVEVEGGWGEAVEGIQMRVRAERQRWYEGETPKFRVDMRNKGTVEWELGLTQENWEVELDGVWHRVGASFTGVFPTLLFGPGQEHKDIEFYPEVRSEWNINGKPLKFTPGLHTVRLSFGPGTRDRAYWRRLRVVSNPVLIEILPAEADKRGWGEAVAGMQCGLRADKRLWKAEETPKLQAVARNVGLSPWRLARPSELFYLKLGSKIWRWKGTLSDRPAALKPGEALDKTTILLSEDWVGAYGSDLRLKLSPGKHIVQLVMFVSAPAPPKAVPGTIPVPRQLRIESNVVAIEVLPKGERDGAVGDESDAATSLQAELNELWLQRDQGLAGAEAFGKKLLEKYTKREEKPLIYYQLAEIYAQSGQADPNKIVEFARQGWWFLNDPVKKARLFIYWGDALQLTKGRRDAGKIYLRGLQFCLQYGLPKEKPELPTVSGYTVDGPAEEAEKHDKENKRQMAGRKHAKLIGELIELRQALTGRIVQLYAPLPDAFDELHELVMRYLGSEQASQQIIAAAKSYRIDHKTAIPVIMRIGGDPNPRADLDWGQETKGIRVRLRADTRSWGAGSVPKFKLDVRNDGSHILLLTSAPDCWGVEADGVWYRVTIPMLGGAKGMSFGPDKRWYNLELSLDKALGSQNENGGFELAPGRHTVRAALASGLSEDGKMLSVGAVSNPVEIVILPTDSEVKHETDVEVEVENTSQSQHPTTLSNGVTAEKPATIRVPEDYPTAYEAVKAAKDGDTLIISADRYRGEDPLIEPKLEIEVEKTASDDSGGDSKSHQHITFIEGMSIREALRFLGKAFKKNIIPSEKVAGQVPVNELYNVTFEEALQAILGTHKYIIDGHFIRVYTKEEFESIYPEEKTNSQVGVEKSAVQVEGVRLAGSKLMEDVHVIEGLMPAIKLALEGCLGERPRLPRLINKPGPCILKGIIKDTADTYYHMAKMFFVPVESWPGKPAFYYLAVVNESFEITGVPPGSYYLFAIEAQNTESIDAVGLPIDWPRPVKIDADGKVAHVEIEMSTFLSKKARFWNVQGFLRGVGHLNAVNASAEELGPYGRVVDVEGKPIPYAKVQVREFKPNRGEREGIASSDARTNEQGYYGLRPLDYPYFVGAIVHDPLINAAGYRWQYMRRNKVFEGKQAINFKFGPWPSVKSGGGMIEGTVVDANDNPIPSFIVDVRPAGPWPKVNETSEPWYESWGFWAAFAGGKFALGDVPEGICNVRIMSHETSAERGVTLGRREVTVSADQTTQLEFQIEDWEKKRRQRIYVTPTRRVSKQESGVKTAVPVEIEGTSFAQEFAKRIMEAYHQEQPKQDYTNYITESLIYRIDSNDLTGEKKEQQIKSIVESIKEHFEPNLGHNLAIAGLNDRMIVVDIYKRAKKTDVQVKGLGEFELITRPLTIKGIELQLSKAATLQYWNEVFDLDSEMISHHEPGTRRWPKGADVGFDIDMPQEIRGSVFWGINSGYKTTGHRFLALDSYSFEQAVFETSTKLDELRNSKWMGFGLSKHTLPKFPEFFAVLTDGYSVKADSTVEHPSPKLAIIEVVEARDKSAEIKYWLERKTQNKPEVQVGFEGKGGSVVQVKILSPRGEPVRGATVEL